jgi:hypothetical protein
MKYAIALLLLSITASAQAQLLVPRGTKATLEVEYLYIAEGKSGRPNGTDDLDEWKVRRVVNVIAHYVAEEPGAIGVLHKADPAQKAALDNTAARAQAFGKKMEPTVADMMKIAERCGEDEACVEKAITEYGNKMDVKEMQGRKAEGEAIFKPGAPRYQLWKVTAQSGSYDVDEFTSHQVFEMTCTRAKACKRTVTSRGKGPIPASSLVGASILEMDGAKKDIAAKMPMPLLRDLSIDTKVQDTLPSDDNRSELNLGMRMFNLAQDLTLAVPSGALPASGTVTVKDTGRGAESGTLTVKWTFKRQ